MANRAIENAEAILDLTEKQEKLKKIIASYAKTISEQEGKASEHQKQRINQLKIGFETRKKELKIAQGIYDTQEELLSITDKESALNFDIAAHKKQIAKSADQIRKLQTIGTKDALKKAKLLGDELKMTKGIFSRQEGMVSKVQAQHQLTEKLLGTLNLSESAMKGMYAQAVLFGKALLANPYLLLLAGVVAMAMALKKAVTFGIDLQDSIGTSASQTIKITKAFADPAALATLKLLGVEVASTTKLYGDAFGDVSLATKENMISLGKQKRLLGITVEDSIKLSKEFMSLTGSSYDASLNFQKMTGELAQANDLRPGDVIADLASNTEVFADFAKDGGKNLAMAAVQARKLGMSLGSTAKIANSLLDFESSIEKEMEASMMIGKQLNFNKARQLALEGDIAGAAKDVVSQIGGAAELNKMNVLQRRALADSIGVSTDELSRLATGKLDIKSDTKSAEEENTAAAKLLNATQQTLINATKALMVATIALTGVMAVKGIADLAKNLGKTLKTTKVTNTGALSKTGGLGKKLANTKLGKGLDIANKGVTKGVTSLSSKTGAIGKSVLGTTGKGVAKRIPGVTAAFAAADMYEGVKTGDKGSIGSGVGMIAGGALGSLLGPMGTVVGSMAGQYIGEAIGDYFEGSESEEQKVAEKKATFADIEQERKDLTAEQDMELQTALTGNAEQMQAFISKYDSMNPFSDTNEMAELLKVLITKTEGVRIATDNLTKD